MPWIKVVGKVLEYTGKLAQADGFEEWAKRQGKGVVNQLAATYGFKILGKTRAATKDLLKDLKLAGRSPALGASLAKVAKAYPGWLSTLADISLFPTEGRFNNKVRALPCFYVDHAALSVIRSYLSTSAELTRLKGGQALRDYFFQEMTSELRKALQSVNASPRKPVPIDGAREIIGLDPFFPWVSGEQPGHYFVSLEDPESEAYDRGAIEENLANLSASLGTWSDEKKQTELKYCEQSFQHAVRNLRV